MPANRIRSICPAIAGAALVGLGVSSANASLTFDVVASGSTGTSVISGAGKIVSGSSVGDTVTFDVFANISNGNGNSADDGLVNAFASFLSANVSGAGAIRGDLVAVRDSNFTASGSSAGKQVDLDADGDLDVGNTVQTSATNWFNARANTAPTPITGNHLHIATLTLTITSANLGGETDVNAALRNQPSSTTPYNWEEDGVFTNGGSVAGGVVGVGSPVVFGSGGGVTPEPASMGLLALGGITALARRRRS